MHVHYGLHFAGGHFHHNGHAQNAVHHWFLQFRHQGFFRHVLDVHVYCTYQIVSVFCVNVSNLHTLVPHLHTVAYSVLAPEYCVITQFQTVLGSVGVYSETAESARSKGTIGMLSLHYFIGIESPFVCSLSE